MMEVSKEVLRQYNEINGFNPNYINKDILYKFIGMLYYNGVTIDKIDTIIGSVKNNPYMYLEKSSDFNKILDDLDTLVYHYDINRDKYQILTDAFDRESPCFIYMNKKDEYILVQNNLKCKYNRYLEEGKL